jgi:hypothetical protein
MCPSRTAATPLHPTRLAMRAVRTGLPHPEPTITSGSRRTTSSGVTNVRVWRSVAVEKIQRVDGVVPGGAQAARKPTRQLPSTRNFTRPAAGRA